MVPIDGHFGPFSWHCSDFTAWLRVGPWGGPIIVLDRPAMLPSFSERVGISRPLLRFRGYRLWVLL